LRTDTYIKLCKKQNKTTKPDIIPLTKPLQTDTITSEHARERKKSA
jgi:hypothetical protein